jgi:hypothetical protein
LVKPPERAELAALPEVPAFLAAFLSTNDHEMFFAICWSLTIAEESSEFIGRLAGNAVPQQLVKLVVWPGDVRLLQAATSVLMTIGDGGYSNAYRAAMPALLRMAERGHPAVCRCFNLLERIAQYK